MNPADIRFKATETTAKRDAACRHCIFKDLTSRECIRAADIAVQRGMPDCDDKASKGKSFIYVLDETDPRQMSLIEGAA